MWWLVSALWLVPQTSAPIPHKEAGAVLASGGLAASHRRLEELTVKDPAGARAGMLLAQTYPGKQDAARERDEPQGLDEPVDVPQSDASPSDETRIHNLIDDVAQSGRVLEAGLLSDRLGEQRQIAPGRPPLLQFRYLEGVKRHGFGSLDLVIDDAGH